MGHILLSFLFYNLLLIIVYSNYKRGKYYINKSQLVFFTILLIAFGTLGSGEGDYLHYKERVENLGTLDLFSILTYDYGMELHYSYLAYILGGNYMLWRLVIFSVQFIGMSWLLYKAKLNTYPLLLCFVAICLLLYTYQRSYWGVTFFFLGLYLLIERRNPLFLIIISLCYFSHTQNLVLLALLPLGFFKLKSWEMLLVILSIGLLGSILGDYITSFLDSGGMEDNYISDKLTDYNQGVANYFGQSIGEVAVFALRYIPISVIVLNWTIKIISKSSQYLTMYKPYRGIINITIGLILVALIFMFANLGSGTFFYRPLSMTLFPIALLLPYMAENKLLSKRSFNTYILVFIICSELSCIKDIYYAYVGGIN